MESWRNPSVLFNANVLLEEWHRSLDHEEEEDYQGDQEEAEQADDAGLQEHNEALAAKYFKVVRVDLDIKKLD